MSLPPLLPLDEAQARLLDSVEALGSETVPVAEAAGRHLAEPLAARRTQPAADLSAMDGYAMRERESGPWRVVGESAAGHPFAGKVAAGEAVRISTGALMPEGADAVLLQENAEREGDSVRQIDGDGPTPDHIRRAGFDFADGDVLLETGARIDPAKLALAIASGNGELAVGKRPQLAVIDSGDELAPDPAKIASHQIPASNGPMLAAMAASFVYNCQRIGPVPDKLEAVVSAFESASGCNVIVTSGGASVGDHDLIRPALERWGAQIDFWRIAVRPGKPLLVARKGDSVVLGLPGNPVSSYVTAYLFLLPLLRKLGGAAAPMPKPVCIPVREAMEPVGERTEFVRARLCGEGVEPIRQRDSSALRALSRADALIRRDAGASALQPGTLVPVYLLQNGGNA